MKDLQHKKIPRKLEKESDKDMAQLESEYPLPAPVSFKMSFKNKRKPFAEELVDSLKEKDRK